MLEKQLVQYRTQQLDSMDMSSIKAMISWPAMQLSVLQARLHRPYDVGSSGLFDFMTLSVSHAT
jgi:hypothetical protein